MVPGGQFVVIGVLPSQWATELIQNVLFGDQHDSVQRKRKKKTPPFHRQDGRENIAEDDHEGRSCGAAIG